MEEGSSAQEQEHEHQDGGQASVATTGSQEEVELAFLAKISNAKIIYNILNGIHLKKDQLTTITIEPTGIKFTVEESRVLQGNCFLQQSLFDEFVTKAPSGDVDMADGNREAPRYEQFRVNLSTLLDCLNIFGGTNNFTSLQILYHGYGGALFLLLEDNGVKTDCGLKTLEPDDLINFNFTSVPIPNKVIMKSDSLKETLNELDWSSDILTVLLSPDPPYFRLTTSGPSGSFQVDYPRDSEVFEGFECTQTQSFSYRLKVLQPTVKALALSTKTSVRMNERGTLNFQHLYTSDDGETSFVDFFIMALDEDADEDDNNNLVALSGHAASGN